MTNFFFLKKNAMADMQQATDVVITVADIKSTVNSTNTPQDPDPIATSTADEEILIIDDISSMIKHPCIVDKFNNSYIQGFREMIKDEKIASFKKLCLSNDEKLRNHSITQTLRDYRRSLKKQVSRISAFCTKFKKNQCFELRLVLVMLVVSWGSSLSGIAGNAFLIATAAAINSVVLKTLVYDIFKDFKVTSKPKIVLVGFWWLIVHILQSILCIILYYCTNWFLYIDKGSIWPAAGIILLVQLVIYIPGALFRIMFECCCYDCYKLLCTSCINKLDSVEEWLGDCEEWLKDKCCCRQKQLKKQ